jgi:hypothetical protein
MDNQEVVKSVCASAGYDIPVSKLFKDDVNKSRLVGFEAIKFLFLLIALARK